MRRLTLSSTKSILVQLTSILIFSINSFATTYYVSNSGNDNSAGSLAAPFQHIQKAGQIMVAGDTCLIRGGVYREFVQLTNSGSSENLRITYKAYPTETPILKGSEQITNWVNQGGTLYRAEIPNSLFASFNPFVTNLYDPNGWIWYGTIYHLGAVYVNGLTYAEQLTQANVSTTGNSFFASVGPTTTSIWINYQGSNTPNMDLTEINVRPIVIQGKNRAACNFITLDSLTISHGATNWSSNEGVFDGMIDINAGGYWAIKNSHITDGRTCGVQAGQHGLGHHLIENNLFERFGQAALVGNNSGWSFSLVSKNIFQDINFRNEFGGAETSAFKAHNTVDLTISKNIFRRVYAWNGGWSFAIWLDWRNQGARISGNIFSDIKATACIEFESSHGPLLVDNNVFILPSTASGDISTLALKSNSNNITTVHNLFVNATDGHYIFSQNIQWYTPHTVNIIGSGTSVLVNNDKNYNNIYIGGNNSLPNYNGFATDKNSFLQGALKSSWGDPNSVVNNNFSSNVQVKNTDTSTTITFAVDSATAALQCPPINYNFVGICPPTSQGLENLDGSPISVSFDLMGNSRNLISPRVGPLENLSTTNLNTITLQAGLKGYSSGSSTCLIPTISNSGFESGNVSPWSNWNGTVVNTNSHSGTSSVQFNGNGSVEQTVSLSPNSAYTLTGWLRASAGSSIRLGVKNFGGAETNIPIATSSWTQVSIDFTTGSVNGSARIYAWQDGLSGSTWADDFVITCQSGTCVNPSISVQPSSIGVTEGATATFSVVAAGTGLTFQWKKNGTNILGATGVSYTTPPTNSADNNSLFSVFIKNNCDSILSVTTTLTINAAPNGTSIPSKIEAEAYTIMSGIQTQASTEGTLNVGWIDVGDYMDYYINVPVAGNFVLDLRYAATNNTSVAIKSGALTLANAGLNNTGGWQNWTTTTSLPFYLPVGNQTIRLLATGGGWNLNWIQFKIDPNCLMPTITVQPNSTSVIPGSTATFSVTASGTNLAYQWKKNDTVIFGATSSSYTTPSTDLTFNNSSYAVTITNLCGTISSNSAILAVSNPNQPPALVNTASAGNNPVLTNTTTLSALGTDDAGEPGLTYTWSALGSPVPNVSFSINGSNSAKNCLVTFTKTGSYVLQVQITDAGNLYVTSNVNVTVVQTLTGITVTPISSAVPITSTLQYSSIALDQFGISLAIQPTFSWAVNGGGTISTSGLFTASITPGGPFSVTASNGSAVGNASVTVICTAPTLSISPANTSVNLGSTATFSVVATGSALSYQWKKNSLDIPGANAGSYTTPPTDASYNNAIYSVVLSNSCGSLTSMGAVLSVIIPNAPPTVATPASASPLPVITKTVTLSALGIDDGGESALIYTWATTGTPPAAVTLSVNGTNSAKNTLVTFAKAGSYVFQVTIKDAGNLTVTSNVNVTVNQTLTTITLSPTTASIPTSTQQQFTAAAVDQFGLSMSPTPGYSWTTSGGGTISASGLFTASTVAGGPYIITATSGTKSGTSTVTVTASNVNKALNKFYGASGYSNGPQAYDGVKTSQSSGSCNSWCGQNTFITADLVTSQPLTSVKVYSGSTKTTTISGSNNGTTWTALGSAKGNGTLATVLVSGSYRYVKVDITESFYGNGNFGAVGINEIEVY